MRKRLLSLGMSLLIIATCFATPLAAFACDPVEDPKVQEFIDKMIAEHDKDLENAPNAPEYYDYYNENASKKIVTQKVTAVYKEAYNKKYAKNFTGKADAKIDDIKKAYEEKFGRSVDIYGLTNKNQKLVYTVTVPETGLYGMSLEYYPLKHKEKDVEISVLVDGALPYVEAKQISLPRIWEDDIDPEKVPEGKDSAGNDFYFECTDPNGLADDIRPSQKEKTGWYEREFINVRGLYSEPYQFYLEAGEHEVTLWLERECVALGSLILGNDKENVSYDSYIAAHEKNGAKEVQEDVEKYEDSTLAIEHQAERTFQKNSIVLYPTYDNSGASTVPNDPAYTKLNSIGQANWNTNGDEIVWKINADQAGFYKLVFRARQNFNEGMYSYRTLKINGEVPFKEAEQIGFKYKQSWYMQTLGSEENPYYIYLNKGENTVSLTCTTGEMSEVLRDVQQSVLDLNEIYREIIAVTSTEPDIYRDYTLDQQIPTLRDDLKAAREHVEATSKRVQEITGTAGSQASSLDYVSKILRELDDTYEIPQRLSSFKNGIETLGSLVSTLSKLALEIDYFAFVPTNVDSPKVGKGILNSASFTWNQFVSSFTVDYNITAEAGENEGNIVNVWVSTGRDQAKIISGLISDSADELVTSDGKRINIQLSMVDTGQTLIRATLAGKGPDCALMIGEDVPINLAARGALLPLTNYREELNDQFHSSAWKPFYYDDGKSNELYALPETQSFDLMFYRTDVFKQFGLEVPKTWEEFYVVMEVLQNANLKVGIPEINAANAGISAGLGTFDKFLIQNGGTYYNSNYSKTRFTEEVAYSAFETWVELYSKYGLDRQFDFYSRFRTGEMPIGIAGYLTYNQIRSAAPELNGLWEFAPIPGTVQEDGTINNSETSVVTGCVMLQSAKEKGVEEAAAKFLQWWVSEETQGAYARELEATLGVAARYAPANQLAFDDLGWSDREAEIIKEQWETVDVMREIPGNYVLKRALTSAFRSAVSGTNSPRRALTIYNKDINDEITRKRKEFNLD